MSWKKLLFVMLLASFSFGVGAYYRFNRIDIKTPTSSPVGGGEVRSGDMPDDSLGRIDIAGRLNILLLGEDNVEGSRRSDTVAFVAVDIDDRNMRVLSMPRDTRVYIPGHGNQKLNHAYAYGKQDLMRATVERFLGSQIHYYVKIDYDNFPRLVDLVGGVDINVGKAMRYRDVRGGLDINIPAGKQRMNGETALKYVRFRKDAQGDIGRVVRQQQFLKALLHRLYDPENLLRFPTIVSEIQNTLLTDMEPSMIMQLCVFVRKLEKEPNRVFFMMLPGTPALIDNLSYWVSDRSDVTPFLTANTQELIEMEALARKSLTSVTSAADYSPDSPDGVKRPGVQSSANLPSPQDILSIVNDIPEAVAVLNGTGKSGVGQSVASHLQKMGVDVAHVGNAKHFDYRSSNVIYPEGSSERSRTTAQMLSRLCGISSTLTRANKQAAYPSLIVGHDYENLLKRLENSYATINE